MPSKSATNTKKTTIPHVRKHTLHIRLKLVNSDVHINAAYIIISGLLLIMDATENKEMIANRTIKSRLDSLDRMARVQ